jgi:hypothetical protein
MIAEYKFNKIDLCQILNKLYLLKYYTGWYNFKLYRFIADSIYK